jgi:hypothetical protein
VLVKLTDLVKRVLRRPTRGVKGLDAERQTAAQQTAARQAASAKALNKPRPGEYGPF